MYSNEKYLYIRVISLFIIMYMYVCMCWFITVSITKTIKPKNNIIINKDIQVPNKLLASPIYLYKKPTPTPVPTITPTPTIKPTPKPVVIDKLSKFSKRDIALIARVTMSEASTQSFDVQVAVAQTVVNRLHSGKFGCTLQKVVYTPNQFSTADNGKPNKQVYAAVKKAIRKEPYPSNMVYFRENYYHKFARDYKKIGVFYFSLKP